MIKFSKNAWPKPYIDMKTELRKNAKDGFQKNFFTLMKNAVYRKTIENVRKHRHTKLATTERRRNCYVLEQHYHTTNFFPENVLAIEMKNTDTLMDKPVHLGLLILESSKMLMYYFWYDYVKLKYVEKAL